MDKQFFRFSFHEYFTTFMNLKGTNITRILKMRLSERNNLVLLINITW